MEFVSFTFAIFFLVTLTGATALRSVPRLRLAFVLCASCAFVFRGEPLFVAVFLLSSTGNWLVGRLLLQSDDALRRRALIALGIAANLTLLGWFRYRGFAVETINDLLALCRSSARLPAPALLVPFGLSFYTFQAIGWLLGTCLRNSTSRSGKVEFLKHVPLLDFLVFQGLFVRVGAGPICRGEELLPQLAAEPPRTVDAAGAGTLVLTGIAKKLAGTFLAVHLVEDAFLQPRAYAAVELWIALFAYTAQIYLDFSGYTDIARGVALALGLSLPDNFDRPYAATRASDYWRRWHMTLSRWLRDYLYLPLGGSRGTSWTTSRNLMLTFLVCGLWHGPSWGYVIWGALHGLALVVEKRLRDARRARGESPDGPDTPLHRALGWAGTLAFVALSRIPFKAPDLHLAWAFARGLLVRDHALHTVERTTLPLVLLLTAGTVIAQLLGPSPFARLLAWQRRCSMVELFGTWALAALVLLALGPFDVPHTLYFRF